MSSSCRETLNVSYRLADGMVFGVFKFDVPSVLCFAMQRVQPVKQTRRQLHPFPSRSPHRPGDTQHVARGWQGTGGAQGDPEGSRESDCSRDGSRLSQINTTPGPGRVPLPQSSAFPTPGKSHQRSHDGSRWSCRQSTSHPTGREQSFPLSFLILTRKEDFLELVGEA